MSSSICSAGPLFRQRMKLSRIVGKALSGSTEGIMMELDSGSRTHTAYI